MDNRSGDSAGGFKVQVRANTMCCKRDAGRPVSAIFNDIQRTLERSATEFLAELNHGRQNCQFYKIFTKTDTIMTRKNYSKRFHRLVINNCQE